MKRVSHFNEKKCDLCGLCLHKCPVLQMPIDEAAIEIKGLIHGNLKSTVLKRCNTCFSCNCYCPQGANPYQLILERWNDLYKERGAPPLYRFVCPTENPNIWQLINIFLSEKEKQWTQQWMNYTPKSGDTVFLIGNYTHLLPFIIGGSKILEHFTPIDRIDQWEAGAYLYQGGYLDVVQRIAEKTREEFDTWGVKTVVPMLDAVYHLFTVVHPREMGIEHTQEFTNFHEWLLAKINAGEFGHLQKINLKVAVHDNCYSKNPEKNYWDIPRGILQKCGCEISEMKHIKQDALCCGFGAGASWKYNHSMPFDIISEAAKRIKEAEETGADALVSYCGGCMYLFWAARELLESEIGLYHMIEIVRMSMGEKLNYPDQHIERAWDIIAIITYQWLGSIFQKNFWIGKITYDKNKSTFRPKNFRLLKSIRFMFKSTLIRKAYARIFRYVLMPVLKTR